MEIKEILSEAGIEVVEGKEAVLNMIKSASDGNMTPLCSGYKVFPDGRKCKGCEDCE
jgi:hypothetical protein